MMKKTPYLLFPLVTRRLNPFSIEQTVFELDPIAIDGTITKIQYTRDDPVTITERKALIKKFELDSVNKSYKAFFYNTYESGSPLEQIQSEYFKDLREKNNAFGRKVQENITACGLGSARGQAGNNAGKKTRNW